MSTPNDAPATELSIEQVAIMIQLKAVPGGLAIDELLMRMTSPPTRRTLQRRLVRLVENQCVTVSGTTRTMRFTATPLGLTLFAPWERVLFGTPAAARKP